MSKLPTKTTTKNPKLATSGVSLTPDNSSINSMLALLSPLIEFHKETEDASDGDLRIFWDVRLVRGKNTPYMSTSGSSSLPGILSTAAARNKAPLVIHQEIDDKIAGPLHNKMQQELSDKNLTKAFNNDRLALENSPQPGTHLTTADISMTIALEDDE